MDKKDKMNTWHYHAKVCTLQNFLEPNELNDLGAIGFELIAVKDLKESMPGHPKWLAIFKKLDIEK
jgi:hypothetical protein